MDWHSIAIIVHRDNIRRIPRIVAHTNITVCCPPTLTCDRCTTESCTVPFSLALQLLL